MWPLLILAALPSAPDTQLTDGLTIGGVARGGRLPVAIDAVQSAMVGSAWTSPKEGDTLVGPDGQTHAWKRAPAPDKDGWIESKDLEGGYYSVHYKASSRSVYLLSPGGASVAYVNGVPTVGDPYGFGFVKEPILLKQGDNELLFYCGQGQLRATLAPPVAPILLGTDFTCPDLIDGKKTPTALVGVQVINASEDPVRFDRLIAGGEQVPISVDLLPLSTKKVTLRLPIPSNLAAAAKRAYQLLGPDGAKLEFHAPFRVRKPWETYKVTFLSAIDGSVQYYAVRPALRPDAKNALVLSLHGASVEASGQADAYGPKTWASIVCPTNRRPYGFDWEDWGRLDALEVLDQAKKRVEHDDSRILLTGHSMGGHGTWHMGTTFPDKFAAIAPSAGWVSFASYAGGFAPTDPNDVEKAFMAAGTGGDTLGHVRNLKDVGVYILHGDADDNVPVGQARLMRDTLKTFHEDFGYHEQPGAGHWWNTNQQEPGASCVDWGPIFDLFARRRLPRPQELRDLEFVTASPNISADYYWIRVEQQVRPFEPSQVKFHVDPNQRKLTGSTENVAFLTLRVVDALGDDRPVTVVLDGQALKDLKPENGVVNLVHAATWAQTGPVSSLEKSATRGSGFKLAITHRFLIVYGTHGTRKENTWMRNKAKFDAESWWYRGNGDVDVIEDDAYDPAATKGRDVLLIGNQETNAAWPKLVKDCPISVTPGGVRVGDKAIDGDDKVVLFCRPTETAMVACVGVTGLPSMHLAERLPYFVSGVAYPDYTVFDGQALKDGPKAALMAGWFTNKWRLAK